jgi:hypothetical protein
MRKQPKSHRHDFSFSRRHATEYYIARVPFVGIDKAWQNAADRRDSSIFNKMTISSCINQENFWSKRFRKSLQVYLFGTPPSILVGLKMQSFFASR